MKGLFSNKIKQLSVKQTLTSNTTKNKISTVFRICSSIKSKNSVNKSLQLSVKNLSTKIKIDSFNHILSNQSQSLIINPENRKTFKIIPIRLNDCLMPFNKTLKVQKTDELVNLLSLTKPEDSYFCVFSYSKSRNITSNIGTLCSSFSLHSNGDEVSFTSKDGDCRVFVDTSSPGFFDILPNNNKTLVNQTLNSKNEDESLLSNSSNTINSIVTRNAIEYFDEAEASNYISNVEVAKNLLSDVNKVIFSFYEVTTKQPMDQSLMREINTAIIMLQNTLKINMDFMNTIASKNFFSFEEELEINNMVKKKETDNSKYTESDYKNEGDQKNKKSLFDIINNKEGNSSKYTNKLKEKREREDISENVKESNKDDNKLAKITKIDEENNKIHLEVEAKDSGKRNNLGLGDEILNKEELTETDNDTETDLDGEESSSENKSRSYYDEDNKYKNQLLEDYKSGKQTTRKKFLKELNSLIFSNIQDFLKIAKGFKKSFPIKDSISFLTIQDPILRIRALIEMIYEIGDYLIKDLHMLEEYKKDVMQKQEKYLLRFVKKQVDKIASGESADNYNKKLEKLFSNNDINEQTKRSIQLEIEQAFNSSIVNNNESEFEDKKKFSILEDIFSFPWDKRQDAVFDVKFTAKVLNTELFGLQKVKLRIDEYIAKLKRTYGMNEIENYKVNSNVANNNSNNKIKKTKGFVILITGPPGTGKTTIAQLIGKALQRKTGIINLSGETDTINLKGSRRTYIDSQPSIFFKEMVKLGVKNPVIILDEIDKIANKGDKSSHSASSALLELLNPEENHNFIDQYLNIPLDFSETIFICTSNYNVNLLEPLLDRVEILEIDDYTFKEKKEITDRYLIPKLLKEYGLDYNGNTKLSSTKQNEIIDSSLSSSQSKENDVEIIFPQKVVEEIIRNYTQYSTGCRNIKRSIEKIIRKINIDLYSDPELQNELKTTPNSESVYFQPHKQLYIDTNLIDKYLANQKTADDNLLKLIKESKTGYLVSDAYGNIGRMILKPRPLDMIPNDSKKQETLHKILKNSTVKDIYKHLSLIGKFSKPVTETLHTAVLLARKKISSLLSDNTPLELENLIKPYNLYFTHPYQEKVGNTFGLVMMNALVANIFEFHPRDENILILGELNPKGHILKVVNLKYILNSCEYYGISKLVLPEGNRSELEAYTKNSELKFDVKFVSHFSEAFDYLYADYIKKLKANQGQINGMSQLNNNLSSVSAKDNSQIFINKNSLL